MVFENQKFKKKKKSFSEIYKIIKKALLKSNICFLTEDKDHRVGYNSFNVTKNMNELILKLLLNNTVSQNEINFFMEYFSKSYSTNDDFYKHFFYYHCIELKLPQTISFSSNNSLLEQYPNCNEFFKYLNFIENCTIRIPKNKKTSGKIIAKILINNFKNKNFNLSIIFLDDWLKMLDNPNYPKETSEYYLAIIQKLRKFLEKNLKKSTPNVFETIKQQINNGENQYWLLPNSGQTKKRQYLSPFNGNHELIGKHFYNTSLLINNDFNIIYLIGNLARLPQLEATNDDSNFGNNIIPDEANKKRYYYHKIIVYFNKINNNFEWAWVANWLKAIDKLETETFFSAPSLDDVKNNLKNYLKNNNVIYNEESLNKLEYTNKDEED